MGGKKRWNEEHDERLRKLRAQIPPLTNSQIAILMRFSQFTIESKIRLLKIPRRKSGMQAGKMVLTERDRQLLNDVKNGENRVLFLSRKYGVTTTRINQILKNFVDNGKIQQRQRRSL